MTLAVDIALNSSGVAVYDGGEFVEAWTIKPKGEYVDKLRTIFATIQTSRYNRPENTLILEDRLQAGWSGKSLAAIEAARTAALLAWVGPVYLYSPGEVKQWLTGKRNASKAEMRQAANWPELANLTEDEQDAVYLYRYHTK